MPLKRKEDETPTPPPENEGPGPIRGPDGEVDPCWERGECLVKIDPDIAKRLHRVIPGPLSETINAILQEWLELYDE